MSYNTRKTLDLSASSSGWALRFLYRTLCGRFFLKLLSHPAVSRVVGHFMNTRLSTLLISGFIKKSGIDMSEYEAVRYPSYNAFFTRKIKACRRAIDSDSNHLISPCDAKLSVYPIDHNSVFNIKDSFYRVEDLLNNPALSTEYCGGFCLIFRLAVDDYHRYCYIDDGTKGENIRIPGILHTVQPIALEQHNIYKRNAREYTVLKTQHFGKVVQVEVGAMMVGKIQNHHGPTTFTRGEEKGYFEFGGSTIVLLFEPQTVTIDAELLRNTTNSLETIVKYGECIGQSGFSTQME